MKMSVSLAALSSLLSLSGCVSLGEDPLLAAMSATAKPAQCNGVDAQSLDASLCAALGDAATDARVVRDGALQLDHAQATLGGVQLASAIATLGFTAFKAHQNNALTSALVGGASLAARDGLRPQARRDVLRSGLRAFNCIVERGAAFIGASARADQIAAGCKPHS